jgi:hypothetical protein
MIYATNLLIVILATCLSSVAAQDTTSPSYKTKGVGKKNVFASEYTIVTAKANFAVNYKRLPTGDDTPTPGNKNFVLGSSIIQSGNVFRPNSVNLVEVLGNFAGGVQPETTADINSAFTFNGECIATAGSSLAIIEAHTCVFNLCLRGSQNCIFLYAGTTFNFNAAPSLKVVNGDVVMPSEFFATTDPTDEAFLSVAQNPLPPSFPGVIIGGVNDFTGITGNFELITVAGTLAFIPNIEGGASGETFSPTANPTTSSPSALSEADEPSSQPTGRPTFDGTQRPTGQSLEPAIVQKLFVKSNIRLPRAPKATGAKNVEDNEDTR